MSDEQQKIPPQQQKPINCSLHGVVNSMVMFNNEVTEFAQTITDIAHLCPHCYIAGMARSQGVEVLNPKPYTDEANVALAEAKAKAESEHQDAIRKKPAKKEPAP